MSYLLQWSEQDHQFHSEEEAVALSSALQDFLQGDTDDYVTVAKVPSALDATRLSHELARKRGLRWSEKEMCWIEPR